MAVRLVRQASETPNITNRDDTKMIRYAYGGYNGIVKDYGHELLPSFSGGELHLGTGRMVLQGWEVDIDGEGWGFISSISSGYQYYVAYLELNLITETAEIKTTYKTGSYPEIDPGDDLTQFPSGTARLPLCQFQIVNGKIAEANRVAPVIPYLTQKVLDLENGLKKLKEDVSDGTVPAKIAQYASEDESKGTIEERLTRLGFKTGVCGGLSYATVTDNVLNRQGNYVIGRLIVQNTYGSPRPSSGEVFFTLPEYFKPKEEFTMESALVLTGDASGEGRLARMIFTFKTNGDVYGEVHTSGSWQSYYRFWVYFGFEAPAIIE